MKLNAFYSSLKESRPLSTDQGFLQCLPSLPEEFHTQLNTNLKVSLILACATHQSDNFAETCGL